MSTRPPVPAASSELPHVLREYALLADGERGALIGPRGDICWLCLPRWHDDPAFSDLLGGPGRYAVTPAGRYVWGGHYERGTLIWRIRWVTDSGEVIECREALARPAGARHAIVLRQLRALSGDARVELALDVRAGAGAHPMTDLHRHAGVWTGRSGHWRIRWTGAPGARRGSDGVLQGELVVPAGAALDLVLEVGLDEFGDPPDPDRLWSATTASWAEGVPDLGASIAPRDAEHAYAVLRGLTSSGGGMAAAATMGLPERAGRRSSYDYRYVWLRDQCYAGLAAAAHGPLVPLHDAVRFATARLLEDGDRIRPAYRSDGGPVPDEHDLDLPGYPGGRPRAGNWVNQQFQLDSLGELLQHAAADGRSRPGPQEPARHAADVGRCRRGGGRAPPPGSRSTPDVRREALAHWLPGPGVAYREEADLGGRRRLPAGEPVTDDWWTVAQFAAYAAHTRTAASGTALDRVPADVGRATVALMCSENLWGRCHRRLIADVAVPGRGVPVDHLMPDGRLRTHRPSADVRPDPTGRTPRRSPDRAATRCAAGWNGRRPSPGRPDGPRPW